MQAVEGKPALYSETLTLGENKTEIQREKRMKNR